MKAPKYAITPTLSKAIPGQTKAFLKLGGIGKALRGQIMILLNPRTKVFTDVH